MFGKISNQHFIGTFSKYKMSENGTTLHKLPALNETVQMISKGNDCIDVVSI